jgi:phosphoesterase RecJ-like protein
VLKEQQDGTYKVSLRSKGDTDVGAIATGFGGGGHQFAAGYTSAQGLQATVGALVEILATRSPRSSRGANNAPPEAPGGGRRRR